MAKANQGHNNLEEAQPAVTVACTRASRSVVGSAEVESRLGKDEPTWQGVTERSSCDLENVGSVLAVNSFRDVGREVTHVVGVVEVNGPATLETVVSVVGGKEDEGFRSRLGEHGAGLRV